MGKVVPLRTQTQLLEELAGDTLTLIRHTAVVAAIKKLCSAHDILSLTIQIEKRSHEEGLPPWDRAAFQDLDRIRCDLVTNYAFAFEPLTLLPPYYHKVGTLISVVNFSWRA